MEVYSLFELNQYIKQVIALNFVDTFWISCEISQINTSRGHCYMELIEKDENTDQIKAMSSGVIWYRDFSFIQKKLGKIVDKVLQEGMLVKLKVELDYHERYGMKLLVKDIDPSFTYGQLAIQREKIIERLKQEGRMHLNDGIPFPTVIQRVAVISSDTAAGYQDLIAHLQNNPYDYTFKSQLFPAAMQGNRTEMEVITQLKDVDDTEEYDVVIITRGGGSKLDLSAFDSYQIAKTISEMRIPVITGIGHDIDMSIADMVSALALKTPTAVANFIIDHNASFESQLYDIVVQIKLNTQQRFKAIQGFLDQCSSFIRTNVKQKLQSKMDKLVRIQQDIPADAKSILKIRKQQLTHYEEILSLVNPEVLLKKGYSISKKDGKVIDSITLIEKGDEITTMFRDGSIQSTVK